MPITRKDRLIFAYARTRMIDTEDTKDTKDTKNRPRRFYYLMLCVLGVLCVDSAGGSERPRTLQLLDGDWLGVGRNLHTKDLGAKPRVHLDLRQLQAQVEPLPVDAREADGARQAAVEVRILCAPFGMHRRDELPATGGRVAPQIDVGLAHPHDPPGRPELTSFFARREQH